MAASLVRRTCHDIFWMFTKHETLLSPVSWLIMTNNAFQQLTTNYLGTLLDHSLPRLVLFINSTSLFPLNPGIWMFRACQMFSYGSNSRVTSTKDAEEPTLSLRNRTGHRTSVFLYLSIYFELIYK